MTVKSQTWNAFSADRRAAVHADAIKSLRKRLRDHDADAKAEARIALPECRYCHYIGSGGISGSAITYASCGICGGTMTFPSTKVDLLCKACADTKGLCRHCGAPGEKPSVSHAPYGFNMVDGKLEAESSEQAVLRLVLSLLANRGIAAGIAESLNAEHIATRTGAPWTAEMVEWAIGGIRQ